VCVYIYIYKYINIYIEREREGGREGERGEGGRGFCYSVKIPGTLKTKAILINIINEISLLVLTHKTQLNLLHSLTL